MKKLTASLALLLTVVLFAAACGSDDDVTEATTGPDDSQSQTEDGTDGDETVDGDAEDGDAEDGAAEDGDSGDDEVVNESIERLWVGPQLVDCVGSGPQKCFLIRRSADGQVEYFYDQIEGFTHEPGTTYVLDVEVTGVENPPADASSLKYRLVEIVEADNTPMSETIDGTSWTLLGFRDGDLFDPVPDGVEVTLNFVDGQANGSAGCNNYMGGYTADGSTLEFEPLAATKMACVGDAQAVEDRFLPLIGTTETAELAFDGTLVLTNPTGPNLLFAPAT